MHRVPSGILSQPEVERVGVGNVWSLIVNSDESAAWITEVLGRTEDPGTPSARTYFYVEEVDKSGMKLLAAGANIDPSSLALSVGGTDVFGEILTARQGGRLYWVQGGQTFSAILN